MRFKATLRPAISSNTSETRGSSFAKNSKRWTLSRFTGISSTSSPQKWRTWMTLSKSKLKKCSCLNSRCSISRRCSHMGRSTEKSQSSRLRIKMIPTIFSKCLTITGRMGKWRKWVMIQETLRIRWVKGKANRGKILSMSTTNRNTCIRSLRGQMKAPSRPLINKPISKKKRKFQKSNKPILKKRRKALYRNKPTL